MFRRALYPDEELTLPERVIHEPMRIIAGKTKRLVLVMIAVTLVSLSISFFLLIWQTIYLQEWRVGNRAILNDVQARVRVIEELEKKRVQRDEL